ncbi:hypothetical protein RHSIM_Rhsim01G0194000 [Rhododendron simsii]|uniref:Uncharacterized protein n=1 Tax=Rhododendron simsii TaxID=118357 RepID=A0A834HHV1_RHOSS|nr:hypothetical protein RHSIM_Rhsim01G0194000 [Rhododendron simsii]
MAAFQSASPSFSRYCCCCQHHLSADVDVSDEDCMWRTSMGCATGMEDELAMRMAIEGMGDEDGDDGKTPVHLSLSLSLSLSSPISPPATALYRLLNSLHDRESPNRNPTSTINARRGENLGFLIAEVGTGGMLVLDTESNVTAAF